MEMLLALVIRGRYFEMSCDISLRFTFSGEQKNESELDKVFSIFYCSSNKLVVLIKLVTGSQFVYCQDYRVESDSIWKVFVGVL